MIDYLQRWLSFFGLLISLGGIIIVGHNLVFFLARVIKIFGGLGSFVFEKQAANIRKRAVKQIARAENSGRFTRWICEWSVRRDQWNSKNLQRQVDKFLNDNGFPSGPILEDDGIASAHLVKSVMSKFGPHVDKMISGNEPVDLTKLVFWLLVIGQMLQIFASVPLSLPN